MTGLAYPDTIERSDTAGYDRDKGLPDR